jgi:uncharacterized membrane protein YgcG
MKANNERSIQLYQTILQTIFIGVFLISLVLIWFLKGNPIWPWIVLACSIALETGRSLYMKERRSEKQEKRDVLFRLFFYGIRVIIITLLVIGLLGGIAIFMNSDCGACAVYQAVGLEVIILWTCVFLGYFLWALYFYNVNLGLTEEDWDKIKREKLKKNSGQFFSQAVIDEEPKYNPYKEQTFGLPPGTVRGMIAFTLLFGAIALIIVGIGMKSTGEQGVVLRDEYEFFKNAFLMMIAFYFGSKSLEELTKDPKKAGNDGGNGGGGTSSGGSPAGGSPVAGSGGTVSGDANSIKTGPITMTGPGSGGQAPAVIDQPKAQASTPPASSDDVIIHFIDPMQKLL